MCLCLTLSLLIACSSEKDVKPNPAAAPTAQTATAREAPAPTTNLSGEYVLTETQSNKTKVTTQEYTCQTTHTYTLQFFNGQAVRYMAKTDVNMDPPSENMMCFSKLYNVDITGTYEVKDGSSVKLTFSPSDKKLPWVRNNIMLLRLNDINTLAIVNNGSEFRKQ